MHVIPSHSESSPSVASPPVVRKLAVVHRQPVAPPSDRTVGRDPPSGALRAARRDPSSAALSEDPLRRHDALVGQEVVCRSHLRRNTGLDVPPGRALWALPLPRCRDRPPSSPTAREPGPPAPSAPPRTDGRSGPHGRPCRDVAAQPGSGPPSATGAARSHGWPRPDGDPSGCSVEIAPRPRHGIRERDD